MILASIPSPDQGVWHLGPVPIRAYALCIILGVVLCIWLGERRWVARGGRRGTVADVAVWAIPFGLVGARLYHVITQPELYFGEGRRPIEALFIWNGGIGIWGAISVGAIGAYIGCRRNGADFRAFADALAPAILLAQVIGRWGNWFNQELFGRPTDLPWGLAIDPQYRPEGYLQYDTFHPTFLYESLWSLAGVLLLLWLDRRFGLGGGRVLALYVMVYTAGRFWVEYLRIDDTHHFFGLRLNDWTSLVCFVLAAAYFLWIGRTGRGMREQVVQRESPDGGDAEPEQAGDPERSAGDEGAADTDDDRPQQP